MTEIEKSPGDVSLGRTKKAPSGWSKAPPAFFVNNFFSDSSLDIFGTYHLFGKKLQFKFNESNYISAQAKWINIHVQMYMYDVKEFSAFLFLSKSKKCNSATNASGQCTWSWHKNTKIFHSHISTHWPGKPKKVVWQTHHSKINNGTCTLLGE